MHIIESRLQSKFSPVPDNGGEDRIVVTDHYAAVIDGTMSKTTTQHDWNGQYHAPGYVCAEIIAQAIAEMPAALSGHKACTFIDGKIRQAYIDRGLYDDMKDAPLERFSAILALYSKDKNYVMLGGECQAIVGDKHYQLHKKTDLVNSEARSNEIYRLIDEGKLTEEALLSMDIDQDPGRILILDPPPNSNFPGLRGQARCQNNIESPFGFFIFDGFANPNVYGFAVIDVPDYAEEIVLATRGYMVPKGTYAVDGLYSLDSAEYNLKYLIDHDPCAYKLIKNTKGKGNAFAFDDRAYVRIKI
jgi:hypothetical protein